MTKNIDTLNIENNSKTNKLIENIKNQKSLHYIIIIITGLLVSIPFLWTQITTMDDGLIHLLRIIGLDFATIKGKFPFLVLPYLCKNWGYSMTAFYPPIVTYIPYLLGIIFGTFTRGLKIFATLTTILSGIFMYNFTNEVTKKKGIALFSAIIYIIFPYRFKNLYIRFAIGKFTAFVFMPIVFQGLYNLLHGDQKRHYYIAIGATGLLLSHTISTEYTAIFCLAYILFNLKTFLKKDVITKCIVNIIFILLMTSLFTIPMFEFMNEAEYAIFDNQQMSTNGESAAEIAIEPLQLLIDKQGRNNKFIAIGIPIFLMLLSGFLVYKRIDKNCKDFYITSVILGLISLIMSTKIFPWAIMPNFLCTLQFPFRIIGVAMLFLSPVCAINIYYLVGIIKKEKVRNIIYIVLYIVLMISALEKFTFLTISNTNFDKEMEQLLSKHTITIINTEYMPLKTRLQLEQYFKERNDKTVIISGEVTIESETKDALHLELSISDATRGTELELPYLFYPGYTIKLGYENKEILLEATESDYGFLKITIPEDIEEGTITVDYTATTLEKVAYIISLVAIIGFVVYVIRYRRVS